MSLYKYTPALTDPEVLKKTIVGRDEQLKTIGRILKSASSRRSLSHALLIGPRGIGKTHILRVIYHAVRGDIEMGTLGSYKNRFVPVITPEEEYVDTIEKFLSLIVDYIASGAPAPLVAPPAARSRDALLSYARSFKEKTGRVLLLLIDNFNDLLDVFTEEDQSALRELLMTSRSVLLIGAAPTLFEAVVNHDKPLYNFFETIWLTDLSFDDMEQMLHSFADIEGRKDLVEEFERSEAKLRAIHALSGGNPRLILSLYQIMAEGDVTSVEATFLKLVDGLSPLFREKMNDISRQQREIIDIMARSDGLLTPTEIASATKLPVNVVNAQIKRLETFGYVQKVPTSHAKQALYQMRERLFALWRQMRVEAGRTRLGFIVKFYEVWYTREELEHLTENLLSELRGMASVDTGKSRSLMGRPWYVTEAMGAPEMGLMTRAEAAYRLGDYGSAEKGLKAYLGKHADDSEAWYNLGITYVNKGHHEEATLAYRKAVEIKPDFAEAWNNLGTTYTKKGRRDDAILAWKKAVEIKPDLAEAWSNLGSAYGKQGRYDDAVLSYKKALEFKPDFPEAWHGLGVAHENKGQHEEAIMAYRKALEIKPDYAAAWNNIGVTYEWQDQHEDAILAWRKAVEIKPDLAEAWSNLGFAYETQGRHEDAIVACKKGLEIKPDLANAWLNLCRSHLFLFGLTALSGQEEGSLAELRNVLSCWERLEKTSLIMETLGRTFRYLLEEKMLDALRTAYREIVVSGPQELRDFLSPYGVLLNYLDTRDHEIIDRLRPEERTIIEEMLKVAKAKPGHDKKTGQAPKLRKHR